MRPEPIYIDIYIHTCMYIYTQTHIQIHIDIYSTKYMYIYTYISNKYMYIYSDIDRVRPEPMYIDIYSYTVINTCIYIDIDRVRPEPT